MVGNPHLSFLISGEVLRQRSTARVKTSADVLRLILCSSGTSPTLT